MKGKIRQLAGFSLIESLLAILIIVLVLSSFVALVIIGLRSFEISKQRFIAAKIAEEGMELTINKKDNHVMCEKSGTCSDWQANLIGSWEVDATKTNELLATGKFKNYDPAHYLCILKTTPNAGLFGYCGDPKDRLSGDYTREVNVTKISDQNILVKSIVKWKSRGFNRELALEEVLFGLP